MCSSSPFLAAWGEGRVAGLSFGAIKERKPTLKIASASLAFWSMRSSSWERESRTEKGGEASKFQCSDGRE